MLSKVDRIIVMEEGNIIIQGHYNELKHLTYFEKFRNSKEEHSLAKIKKINDLQETASDTSNAQKVTKSSSFIKDESKEEISPTLASGYPALFGHIKFGHCLPFSKPFEVMPIEVYGFLE